MQTFNSQNLSNKYKVLIIFCLTISLLMMSSQAFAYVISTGNEQAPSLGQVSENVLYSLSYLSKLIVALSFIIGFAFGVGAIIKYKAHRDNPNMMPISTPITLVFVALTLICLPMVFTVAGATLFGQNQAYTGTAQGTTQIK